VTGDCADGAAAGAAAGAEPATAAAAAAAYLIGGRATGLGGGAEAAGAATGAGAGTGGTGSANGLMGNLGISCLVVSMVDFRLGCFFADTGLGGWSSATADDDFAAGVDFFSFSSFAGVFGADDGGTSDASMSEAESRLEVSSP
jgi:hypothetical protein